MTMARIQPFCRAKNINLGYYNNDRNFPRTVMNRDIALYLYNNRFCLIWKSQKNNFNRASNEFKKILKKLIIT